MTYHDERDFCAEELHSRTPYPAEDCDPTLDECKEKWWRAREAQTRAAILGDDTAQRRAAGLRHELVLCYILLRRWRMPAVRSPRRIFLRPAAAKESAPSAPEKPEPATPLHPLAA